MRLFKKLKNDKNIVKNAQESVNKPEQNTSFYSDKGRKKNQEDAYLITNKVKNKQLILVADGLGGLEYGEFASNQAIEVFKNFFVQNENFATPKDFLTKTTFVVASMLKNKSNEDVRYNECATTLTGFMIIDNLFYTVNVGDSRVYMFSENNLSRKTKDHSFVQHLIDKGEIKEEEAFGHPKKNIIYKIILHYFFAINLLQYFVKQ